MTRFQWMEFGPDRAYLLMAIARRKENPELESEIVFREVIKDRQDIDRKYEKLKALINGYGDYTWRLYASINGRNVTKAYATLNQLTDGWVQERATSGDTTRRSREFKRIDNHWYSALQKDKNADDSYFIFDLDTSHQFDELTGDLLKHIDEFEMIRETPNGWHIVTEPFNYTEVESDTDYELKRDGLLFIEKFK